MSLGGTPAGVGQYRAGRMNRGAAVPDFWPAAMLTTAARPARDGMGALSPWMARAPGQRTMPGVGPPGINPGHSGSGQGFARGWASRLLLGFPGAEGYRSGRDELIGG